MRLFSIALAPAALLTLCILVGCSAQPAGGGSATPEPSGPGGRGADFSRVIVALKVPDYEKLLQASQKGLTGADQALTQAIRDTAERVAADVAAEAGTQSAMLLEVFRFSPSAVFRTDAAGRKALRNHPAVGNVQEDKGVKPL